MVKKKSRQGSVIEQSEEVSRKRLPEELEGRLQAIWAKLGNLVEWCDSSTSWLKMFCAEARPYRETFYWEAVAQMVSDYLSANPTVSAERVLTDCVIATQCSPSPDDPDTLIHFRETWQRILDCSRDEIEQFIKADLDLAMQDGTYETVARLYAADYGRWKKGQDGAD